MKFEDCYIELLQEFPCVNKMQLNKKEGEYIRSMDCVNKNIAGRTPIEWREEHKTEKNEQMKQYYIDNKTEINEKNNQYKIDNRQSINEKQNQKYNCCCGGKYTNVHKQRHFKSPKHLTFINSLETTTA
jgi:hypothetical protein